MLRVYLEQEGYRVVEAGHGREALYVARYEKPDLIILDLMMPEMGGYEFMRVFSREASTPVIMLTAKVEDTDKILGLELGADDYVTKPFNVRELLARVHAVLRRRQKAQAEPDMLELLDRVQGDAYEGYERTIDVHVRNLRTKIEPDPRRPKYVETVYGMGYRFAPERPPGPTDDKPLE